MLPLLGLAGLYCGCGASRPPTLSIFAGPGNRVVKLRLLARRLRMQSPQLSAVLLLRRR